MRAFVDLLKKMEGAIRSYISKNAEIESFFFLFFEVRRIKKPRGRKGKYKE